MDSAECQSFTRPSRHAGLQASAFATRKSAASNTATRRDWLGRSRSTCTHRFDPPFALVRRKAGYVAANGRRPPDKLAELRHPRFAGGEHGPSRYWTRSLRWRQFRLYSVLQPAWRASKHPCDRTHRARYSAAGLRAAPLPAARAAFSSAPGATPPTIRTSPTPPSAT